MEKDIEIFNTLRLQNESEVVEFKEAKENFDIDDLGKYFSALSNEANLRQHRFAWIVFGVHDKTKALVGTNFKNGEKALHKLKNDMAQHITGGLIFRDIIEVKVEEDDKVYRILMFKIPASPHNIVTCWKGIAYGRKGESLKPLDQAKQDEIRNQPPLPDWSEQIVKDATMKDLDALALAKARIEFGKVHASSIPEDEIKSWSDEEFLQYCGIMRDGQLTRAALLLLGKPVSAIKLRPAVAEVTWVLRNEDGDVADYQHFGPPFILTVNDILKKIRNLTMREMPGGTLFPDTMQQYDDYTIREALNNALAHQDYLLEQRVNFVENPDSLYYENGGTFAPVTINNVLDGKAPQRYYRNRCLCEAMYHLNMIDKVGRGIQKIYRKQKERHFPMPDYVIDDENRTVAVTIYGRVIDDTYAQMLQNNTSLSLKECILLDAVQKKRPITDDALALLRKNKLVEGRKNNLYISKWIAQATNQEADYSRNKGIDEDKCRTLLLSAIDDHIILPRKKIDELLYDLLPKGLTDEQKRNKVDYLLKKLSKSNIIAIDKEKGGWKRVAEK